MLLDLVMMMILTEELTVQKSFMVVYESNPVFVTKRSINNSGHARFNIVMITYISYIYTCRLIMTHAV